MSNLHNVKKTICLRPAPRGLTMTEYALILAAVATVAIVAYTKLGKNIVTTINKAATATKTKPHDGGGSYYGITRRHYG